MEDNKIQMLIGLKKILILYYQQVKYKKVKMKIKIFSIKIII